MWGVREEWLLGEPAWFEYHCYESHDSADAELWYHSHQRVIVVGRADCDAWDTGLAPYTERQDAGMPRCYEIRFPDGFQYTATEDELFTLPQFFYRPDPPERPWPTPISS